MSSDFSSLSLLHSVELLMNVAVCSINRFWLAGAIIYNKKEHTIVVSLHHRLRAQLAFLVGLTAKRAELNQWLRRCSATPKSNKGKQADRHV